MLVKIIGQVWLGYLFLDFIHGSLSNNFDAG